MTEKYNLEKAITNDIMRIWNENRMDSCNKSGCNCKDNISLIKYILKDNNFQGSIDYRDKKLKEIFFNIMDNEKRIMPCGHQWYSYNCQEYSKNVKELIEFL